MRDLKVIFVEDSADDLKLLLIALRREGFNVEYTQVIRGSELAFEIKNPKWDVVISDYSLGGFSGLEALKLVREVNSEIPFILVSGSINEEIAVNILKAGANDYVLKDNLIRLGQAVARELAEVEGQRALMAELRAKEDQLRHAQKMELIGSLVGGIAHDFNNYLAVVMINSETALDLLDHDHPARKLMEQINTASERAAALARRLLMFNQKRPTQPALIDLNEAVRQSHRLLARLVSSEIDFTIEVPDAEFPVNIDPVELEQVLLNLIVNSRDAMPNGGQLSIKTFNDGKNVGFIIADTGTGMDKVTVEKIFEPFFTTKSSDRGTGLGLSTVKTIIADAKGEITVESELNMGTRFRVTFPVSKDQMTEKPAALQLSGSETVLVVDDDPEMRRLMVEILKQNGYQALEASSPAMAEKLSLDFTGEIHLLVSDMMMPSMSGLEFSSLMAQSRQKMRVLFVTGLLDKEMLKSYCPEGIRILSKPFSRTALLENIRATLDLKKP